MKCLTSEWKKLCEKYTSNLQLIAQCFQEITQRYSEKHRVYHDLSHISALLELASEWEYHFTDIDAVRWAIWYHDVVYSPTDANNEEKSVQFARQHLPRLNVVPEKLDKICTWILATKDHTLPSDVADTDGFLFLDIDLSILGASSEVYQSYSKAIRQEYSIYPDFLYKVGRKKVLKNFLQKKRIYHTDLAFNRWETPARANIKSELENL